ncbi:MAG: hypothetical protein AVDCRST_MAG18-3680, partial [uncultured Thermomicrobiales bacterium]
GVVQQPLRQGRFPDARLAADQDEGAASDQGGGEGGAQRGLLPRARRAEGCGGRRGV